MKKDLIPGLQKKASELMEQAGRLGKEAAKTATTVKGVVQTGVKTSQEVLHTASQAIDRDKIKKAFDATSKGAKLASKGVRAASKGAEVLAGTLEKASEKIRDLGTKISKK